MSPQFIGEAIPAEVETGAGSYFAKPKGKTRSGGDAKKPAQEDGRAADLVGLRRRFDGVLQEIGIRLRGSHQRGPGIGARLAAGRWQPGGEIWRAAGERQIVQPAKEAKRQGAEVQIAGPAGEDLSEEPAIGYIPCRIAHEPRPQGRT